MDLLTRSARWVLSLARCNYSIEYKRSAINKVADVLSPAPIQDTDDEQTNPKSSAVDNESESRTRED